MKRIRSQRLETVILKVKGKLLDRRTFASHRDADNYKQASRAWAMKHGIVVEVWSDQERAGLTSPAGSPLIAQAG